MKTLNETLTAVYNRINSNPNEEQKTKALDAFNKHSIRPENWHVESTSIGKLQVAANASSEEIIKAYIDKVCDHFSTFYNYSPNFIDNGRGHMEVEEENGFITVSAVSSIGFTSWSQKYSPDSIAQDILFVSTVTTESESEIKHPKEILSLRKKQTHSRKLSISAYGPNLTSVYLNLDEMILDPSATMHFEGPSEQNARAIKHCGVYCKSHSFHYIDHEYLPSQRQCSTTEFVASQGLNEAVEETESRATTFMYAKNGVIEKISESKELFVDGKKTKEQKQEVQKQGSQAIKTVAQSSVTETVEAYPISENESVSLKGSIETTKA